MSQIPQFSEKEKRLLAYFDLEWAFKQDLMTPPLIYKMAVEKAFLNNDQTEYAESLRRCIAALNKCSVYRMTPEWDDLITI